MDEKKVLEALSNVIEPESKKDIVELGLVSEINIEGSKLSFTLKLSNPTMHYKKSMEEAVEQHLFSLFPRKSCG